LKSVIQYTILDFHFADIRLL